MRHSLTFFSLILGLQALTTEIRADELSAQESFHLKRISEYWKEKDYETARKQILDYLESYPKSSANEHLYAMLGDLHFHENQFEEALCAYEQIENASLEEKTIFNQIQCLFELKDYPSVVDLSRAYFEGSSRDPEEGAQVHFMAGEALFKQGLKTHHANHRETFFSRAKPHYDALLKTPYEEFALFPLAEIHKALKEDAEAVDFYLILAEKNPEKNEEFLFQAAVLQVQFDISKAIETFGKVVACKGKRAPLAAYNQLTLFFQDKHYEDVLRTYEHVRSYLAEKHLSKVNFYLGKSHFALHAYEKAVAPLALYVDSDKPEPGQLKNALISLAICAKELQNPELFNRHLQDLAVGFPECDQLENLRYDYALLLSQKGQWALARAASLEFLKHSPDGDKALPMLRHLLFSSQNDVKNTPNSEKQEHWIADLQMVLGKEDYLSDNDVHTYRNLLIKALHDDQRYHDAVKEIDVALSSSPDDIHLHLWAASCHQRLSSMEGFITHAERALALNSDLPEKGILHLELYNTYLDLAQSKPELLDKAAENLFHYSLSHGETMKEDNLRWLANYYYDKALKADSAALEKAENLFTALIKNPLGISKETLYLEKEILKWSDLLALQKRWDKRISVLSSLSEEYKKNPDLHWKFQRRALFELAKSYEAATDQVNALKTYEFLVSSSTHVSSYIGCASSLQKARLKYAFLEASKKQENSPEMTSILNDLKDLQIKKKLSFEPLHLEAGLEYVEIKSSLAQESEELSLLNRFREDFSKAYSTEHLEQSDRRQIYETYMKYAQIKTTLLEAKASRKQNDMAKARDLEQKAILDLEELLKIKDTLTPYLLERVQKTRAQL